MKAIHLQTFENQLSELNDGKFSILIIGERGTGKSSILQGIGESIQADQIIDRLNSKSDKPIVIDLIEHISFQDQKVIFDLISTGPGNKLINVEETPTCPQLIFTTQMPLTILYEDENFYKPFIDRIAQQLICLTPLRKLKKEQMQSCWESVNKLMLFEDKEYIDFTEKFSPVIINYLTTNLYLNGNFRDLEKLAISLWRYVLNSDSAMSKGKVNIKLEEFRLTHETDIKGEFFKLNANADSMIKDFRQALVDWSEKKYSALSRSELIKKLEISEKTYYNWKNGL